jgi:hypothetical protein
MVRRWAEQTKLPWLRDDEMSMQSENKFRCSFLGFDAVFWGSGTVVADVLAFSLIKFTFGAYRTMMVSILSLF